MSDDELKTLKESIEFVKNLDFFNKNNDLYKTAHFFTQKCLKNNLSGQTTYKNVCGLTIYLFTLYTLNPQKYGFCEKNS